MQDNLDPKLDPKLDPTLMRRLLRPIERPGVIDRGMSWGIVARSQRFANRLPLVSYLSQRLHHKVGFQEDKTPIVYARSLPETNINSVEVTAAVGSVDPPQFSRRGGKSSPFSELSPPSHSTPIVQAKFVSEDAHSGLANIDNRANQSSGLESESLEQVEVRSLPETNINSVEVTAAVGSVDPPQFSRWGGKSSPFSELSPPSHSTPIVQAKFVSEDAHSGLANIDNRANQSSGLESESLEQVEVRSLPKTDMNPVKLMPIQTPIQKRRSPQPQNIWSGLEIPLIFSTPGANTNRVKAESVKTESGATNPGITGLSRTENQTQSTRVSSNESLNVPPDEQSNIQSNIQDKANAQSPIDLDALTDKIERNLMQRLIIESERRGRKTWS